MREYHPNIRIHDVAYLVKQAQELKGIATAYENSSSLIYACLELRMALELIEFEILLASVSEELRPEIAELSKTKNGIDKANKKLKTLKEKFQLFYQAVCEVLEVKGQFFDFKTSDDLQFKLSKYLHTYTRTQSELDFKSDFMQQSISLIEETISFINKSLSIEDDNSYTIQCIDINKIPDEDKAVLEEWKQSVKMTYEGLLTQLKENLENRKR